MLTGFALVLCTPIVYDNFFYPGYLNNPYLNGVWKLHIFYVAETSFISPRIFFLHSGIERIVVGV